MIQLAEEYTPEPVSPVFAPGQLVHHQRYGYRGVVVAYDANCRASREWYLSNMTQPPLDQPWYHVFVDGGTHTTYVAESSLKADSSGVPIAHPLLPHFFTAFEAGSYLRNDRPWGQ